MELMGTQVLPSEIATLKRLVDEVAYPGLEGVELGTYTGGSALGVLPIFKAHGGRLWLVDWFKGNEGLDEGQELSRGYATANVRDLLLANLREAGHLEEPKPDAIVVNSISWEAASGFQDGSLAYVFVDADHRYTGVAKDLEAWWPKVAPGGIICGHDFDRHARDVNPEDLVAFCEQDTHAGDHLGVIRAVCERWGNVVQAEGRIWWVRKT